jgi:hypothetical protein
MEQTSYLKIEATGGSANSRVDKEIIALGKRPSVHPRNQQKLVGQQLLTMYKTTLLVPEICSPGLDCK